MNKKLEQRRAVVAGLYASGKSTAEIAAKLGKPYRTIAKDVQMLKSQADDFEDYAREQRLILRGQIHHAAGKNYYRSVGELSTALRRWFPPDAHDKAEEQVVWSIHDEAAGDAD